MPSPGNRGFYAEVDEMLLIEFEKHFPNQGSKVLLITKALQYAIQTKSLFFNPGGGDVYREQRNTASGSTKISGSDDLSQSSG
jgi:hypothetical protein